MSDVDPWDWARLRRLVAGEPLPAMVVDLDVFDANVRRLAAVVAARGKRLRPASKSVRVPDLQRRIAEVGAPHVQGVMCFAAAEARFLAGCGLDDLLIAYPTVQPSDLEHLWAMTQAGTVVTAMVDEPAHVDALAAFWAAHGGGHPLRVCIDMDVSWRPLGQHVGVERSPVRTLEDFGRLLDAILARPELRLAGVMGYEAQIAGVGDDSPFAPVMNAATKLMKSQSVKDVAAKRGAVARLLAERGVRLEFFNGGGTGSIRTTSDEPWITEVAAGSGFLQSHLFDYYAANENRPAFCFALQVTRVPEPGIVTCQSGGFVASGPPGPDKAPLPFRPAGLRTTKSEGTGEVQTPLVVPEELRGQLTPGVPVFFRPAKAGEIAERFREYLLCRGEEVVERVPTYRGLGQSFF
jgi:D-serine deaminase-like pyridoxal phosphate-dependent protein